METKLLHIFRNTPLGRETLLQSIYFCNITRSSMVIYIPEYTKFLMYFDNDVVQVDLDPSYLLYPETSRTHALDLTKAHGIDASFFEPRQFTASTLPDIPVDFDFMCSPRSISDLSSKISLGHIGTRVRRIIKTAQFPVLLTSPCYKEWTSILVFFGGSVNSVKAVRLGLHISRLTGLPLDLFTQVEGSQTMDDYKDRLKQAGLEADFDKRVRDWKVFADNGFEENLYHVPHQALAVLGAYGHGLVKDILFGSKMEVIQSVLSNNLLIVGPRYSAKG
ncbi:MAG: universal stress protein [Proteobacteria bacterium]|nr:universal stress protein [Pseudomonadota bacterium]